MGVRKVMMNNKTVLISGASRGLGCEIAKEMFSQRANLVLVARSLNKLESLRKSLNRDFYQDQFIKLYQTDLADKNAVADLVNAMQSDAIRVDILVNNAAMQGPIGPTWENDWQEWQHTLQVNLFSPIELCRACIPNMIKQRYGKIINLSGGGATGSRPNFSAYAVSKVGLVKFSEILAHEVAPYNIDVNCVAPGVMNSELLAEVVNAGAEKAGEREYEIAKQNAAAGNDVAIRAAETCGYLASSQSNGITGKLISAVWDPWYSLHEYLDDLKNSDIYTLRRIIPKERGKDWGEV